ASRVPATSLLVVNTASHARTDVVRVFVPSHLAAAAVRDELTGAELPVAIEPGPAGRNRPQGRTLSFLAHDVPALGFRRYTLQPGEPAPAAGGTDTVLENEHYRLELDLGGRCVARLVDKELGVDLVDSASPFGFGGYVYDRYAGGVHGTLHALPGRDTTVED